jgi:Fur family ferric uptake transcriptional regulator
MAHLDDFVTAQRLHAILRDLGDDVGLTTVYRTLQAMADAGELDQRITADGEASYRCCSPTHHHHLVCRECGTTVEIAGPDVEAWAERIGRQHGFTELDHTIELTGRCRVCSG